MAPALMRRSVLASYVLGLLLLSALVGVVAQLGEIEQFVGLMRKLEPSWLVLGLALQSGTYLCESLVWKRILRHMGYRLPLGQLLPLSLAKLFSDQAMPSAGLSGDAFFLAALRRRGVGRMPAISCIVVDLAAHFAAYACMTTYRLLVLGRHHEVGRWQLALAAVFSAMQASISLAIWHAAQQGRIPGTRLAARYPRLLAWTGMLRTSTSLAPVQPVAFVQALVLDAAIMLLDAATLWAMLLGLGQAAAFTQVLPAFMMASMVMSLSPIPMGLGTFEASCVALLHGAGTGIEAALTATVLLRGTTTWLPMLPGIWLIRRELRSPYPRRTSRHSP